MIVHPSMLEQARLSMIRDQAAIAFAQTLLADCLESTREDGTPVQGKQLAKNAVKLANLLALELAPFHVAAHSGASADPELSSGIDLANQ